MWNNTYIDGGVAYNMTGLTSQGNNTFTVTKTTLNIEESLITSTRRLRFYHEDSERRTKPDVEPVIHAGRTAVKLVRVGKY